MADSKEGGGENKIRREPAYGTLKPRPSVPQKVDGIDHAAKASSSDQPPKAFPFETPTLTSENRLTETPPTGRVEVRRSVTQTRRAGDADFAALAGGKLRAGHAASRGSRNDASSEGSMRLQTRNLDSVVQPQIARSTWNLRIRRRDVDGYVSGIINPIPEKPCDVTGLQSAFVIDDAAPEYKIEAELGKGSMGIVYMAQQLSLNRELAIKTLKPDSEQPDYDQAMFVSEAVVTANLVHPNIIPIHDLGRTADGKLFYSMKKVDGTPWHKLIDQLSIEDNLDVLLKVCDAVAFAHSKGVINRDLKPENVVVGKYGEVVVLDWGLAITTAKFEKKNSVVVDFRGCAGTPAYMAPELLEENVKDITHAADIYLLGAILFQIMEGYPPNDLKKFRQVDDQNELLGLIIDALRNGEVEDDIQNAGELMQITRKAMSWRISDRHPSVEALQDAIREYRITGRAEEIMNSLDPASDDAYTQYQTALALYSDALLKWPFNQRALAGKRRASLEYAEFARKKGDYDLGLQVAGGESDPAFRKVVSALKRSRKMRKFVRLTWGVTTVVSLVAMTVAVLFAGEADIQRKTAQDAVDKYEDQVGTLKQLEKNIKIHKQAESDAKTEADRQTDIANEAKAETERQKDKTKEQEDLAMAAIADAKQAKQETESQKDKTKRQKEEAEKQTKIAMEAKAEAEQQKVAAKEAEDSRMKAEIAGLEAQLTAFQALENWEEVEKICDKAVNSEDFRKNRFFKLDEFEEQLEKAKQHLGNSKVPLSYAPDASATSGDGRTVATVKPGTPPRLDVRHFETDNADPQLLAIDLPEIGLVKDLAVSIDGSTVAVVTKEGLRLFQRNGSELKELSVPDSPKTKQFAPDWMTALFSGDGRFLFLVSGDQSLLTHVYRLDGANIEIVSPPNNTLGGRKGDAYAPRNGQVVLLPDASSLIVNTKAAGCKSLPIEWNGDRTIPSFPKRLTDRDCPGDRGAFKEAMKVTFLKVSPDCQYLAVGMGRQTDFSPPENDQQNSFPGNVVLYPLRADLEKSEFPFDLTGKKTWIPCKFEAIQIYFSHDSSRIATLHNKGVNYMSLWDLKGDHFVACEIPGLFKHFATTVKGGRVPADRSLNGHSKSIATAAFFGDSPDRLISVAIDESIRRWSVSDYANYKAQFEELREAIRPRPASGKSASFHDGSRKVQGRRGLQPLVGLQRFGQSILTGLPVDESVDAVKPIRSKDREGQRIFSARFNADGSRVLVTSDLRSAQVFDTGSGQRVTARAPGGRRDLFYDSSRDITLDKFVEGHSAELSAIRFVPPDGKFLLTEDYYGSISVWDSLPDENGVGQEVCRLLSESASSEFAISDDGQLVLAGGAKVIEAPEKVGMANEQQEYFGAVWDLSAAMSNPSPSPRLELRGGHPKYSITAVGISPSSKRLVTAGRRGRIVVWSAEDGSMIAEADGAHGADQVSGIFFEDEEKLVSSGYDGRLIRWTIDGKKLTQKEVQRSKESPSPDYIIRLRPSADRRKFATTEVRVREEKEVRIKEILVNIWLADGQRTLIQRKETKDGDAFESDISWSADGGELMLVLEGDISVFETETWKLTNSLRPNAAFAKALRGDFSSSNRDGKNVIATIGDDRVTHLWSTSTRSQLAKFQAQEDYSVIASYSSDQNFVVTGSETLRIYMADETSPQNGTTLFRVNQRQPHRSPIADVRFSPASNDLRLASIDFDGLIQIWNWNAAQPTPLTPLGEPRPAGEDHETRSKKANIQPKNSLVWAPDGKQLAAIQSGKLSVLQLKDSEIADVLIAVPDDEDHEYIFNDVTFSLDGGLLAAAGLSRNPKTEGLSAAMVVWRQTPDAGFEVYANEYTRLSEDSQHSVAERSKVGQSGITAVAFRGDREILTGGADARLKLWTLEEESVTEKRMFRFREEFKGDVNALLSRPGDAHDGALTEIELSRNGKMVTADDRGSFIIWPAPSK